MGEEDQPKPAKPPSREEDDSHIRPGLEDWDSTAPDPEADRLAGIFKRLRKRHKTSDV